MVVIMYYSKCSKILLFSNEVLVIRAGIHKMLNKTANREDSNQTASSEIWVCTVCLGLFGRQLVIKILEHLPYSKTCLKGPPKAKTKIWFSRLIIG